MTENPDIDESELPDAGALRDADDHLSPAWVEGLRELLTTEDAHELADRVAPLYAADLGDVLEALTPDERVLLVTLLGDKFDFSRRSPKSTTLSAPN